MHNLLPLLDTLFQIPLIQTPSLSLIIFVAALASQLVFYKLFHSSIEPHVYGNIETDYCNLIIFSIAKKGVIQKEVHKNEVRATSNFD